MKKRVVVARNRVTGAGITAGVDFAFRLAAELFDARTAQEVQLAIEYDPLPPFDAGSPDGADSSVRESVRARSEAAHAPRRAALLAR